MKITLRPGDTLEVECEPPVGKVVATSRWGYQAGAAPDIVKVTIEMPPAMLTPEPIRAQLPPAFAQPILSSDVEDRRVPRYEDQVHSVTPEIH